MKKVTITGQPGFIGTHLFNYLKYIAKDIELIPFEDKFFEDDDQLKRIIRQADVVVHLAALNRHNNPQIIYETNKRLVQKIIDICKETNSKPHVIFASSTQEERNNPYGLSKKEGRLLFARWAKEAGAKFTGLIIPNVYGPFGKPYYNSVIATFSYQLIHGEMPKIDVDAELKLIYVQELAERIYQIIIKGLSNERYLVPHTSEQKVSAILRTLSNFKKLYLIENIIPELNSKYEINLFNTFRTFLDYNNFFPRKLEKKSDQRGYLVESVKGKTGGQLFYSVTRPGITRGNHFHTRKIERFVVIQGKGLIRLRKIGSKNISEYRVSGDNPVFIDMPIWYTHNITNIGNDDMITLFWSNEIFDPNDADTYYEEVDI